MAAPRFFCPDGLAAGATIDLPESVAHYAARVLRLKDGAALTLFDGQGGEYPATLFLQGKRVGAILGPHLARDVELGGEITLVQGLPSGDKMDWIIEKASELGVQRVVPIAAERSVLQLSGARLDKRQAHWQRVAESAAEQCGRNRILDVTPLQTLGAWLGQPASGVRLLCHPALAQPLRAALPAGARHLSLLIGPEGGWSEAELKIAQASPAVQPVRWGERVMRTETAGVAMSAACIALLDWA